MIYSINTIIKCSIWQPVKFQLVSLFLNWIKNDIFFYRISELMLATLSQRYNKKSFHFKDRRLTEILRAVRCHILWLFLIPYINLLSLSWIKKMSIFEEYGAFNHNLMPHSAVSDKGLHSLLIPVCPNTLCDYGTCKSVLYQFGLGFFQLIPAVLLKMQNSFVLCSSESNEYICNQ